MLDHEVKWRVFEHMQSKGRTFKKPKVPRPPEVREIWHNAFLEDIAKTEDVQLGAALAASANALAGLNAAGLGDSRHGLRAPPRSRCSRSASATRSRSIGASARTSSIFRSIPAFGGDIDGGAAGPADPARVAHHHRARSHRRAARGAAQGLDCVAAEEQGAARAGCAGQHKRDVEDLRSGFSPLDVARAVAGDGAGDREGRDAAESRLAGAARRGEWQARPADRRRRRREPARTISRRPS